MFRAYLCQDIHKGEFSCRLFFPPYYSEFSGVGFVCAN
jgi:hypothetical protein